MQQHPIPQNVSQYRFRLIGDMTIKQFAYLAGGIIIGIGAFKIPFLPFALVTHWLLAIFFSILGAAFAFLPFEERPLDVCVINFIRAVWSPTIFLWKKQFILPDFFNYSGTKTNLVQMPHIPQKDKAAFDQFISTMNNQTTSSPVDLHEENRMKQIEDMLKEVDTGNISAIKAKVPQFSQNQNGMPMTPIAPNMNGVNVNMQNPQTQVQAPQTTMFQQQMAQNNFMAPQLPQVNQNVNNQRPIQVPTATTNQTYNPFGNNQATQQPLIQTPKPVANIVWGTVYDGNKNPQSQATVEIKDATGKTVRTLKTDDKGIFSIHIPLSLGLYWTRASAANQFSQPQSFTITDQGCAPLKLFLPQSNPIMTPQAPRIQTPQVSQAPVMTVHPTPTQPVQAPVSQPLQQIQDSPMPQVKTEPVEVTTQEKPQTMDDLFDTDLLAKIQNVAKTQVSDLVNKNSTSAQPLTQIPANNLQQPVITAAQPLTPPMKIGNTRADYDNETDQTGDPNEMLIQTDTPNTLIGTTLDQNGKIISNTIIDVIDQQNFPVRTVKTNELGQFFIVTALPNGPYTLRAEHQLYNFTDMQVNATGQLIAPIKIVGQQK